MWLIILFFDFGVKSVDGIDMTDYKLLYGYQPTLDIIMFFDSPPDKGYGVSTFCDVWIGLFPISMYMVYIVILTRAEAEEGFDP